MATQRAEAFLLLPAQSPSILSTTRIEDNVCCTILGIGRLETLIFESSILPHCQLGCKAKTQSSRVALYFAKSFLHNVGHRFWAPLWEQRWNELTRPGRHDTGPSGKVTLCKGPASAWLFLSSQFLFHVLLDGKKVKNLQDVPRLSHHLETGVESLRSTMR